MDIEGVLVETETSRRVKAKKRSQYVFFVNEADLRRLRRLGLSAPSVLAFGLIRAAARAARKDQVSIRERARAALGYSADWWRKHTRELELAGVIERDVRPGRKAAYRIVNEGE